MFWDEFMLFVFGVSSSFETLIPDYRMFSVPNRPAFVALGSGQCLGAGRRVVCVQAGQRLRRA